MADSEAKSELSAQLELGLAAANESAPVEQQSGHGNGKSGKVTYNLCPVCGMHTFGYVEGCAKCMSCGHSEC
jgi:ribonucleoside-diphosphate reductase alpha chain